MKKTGLTLSFISGSLLLLGGCAFSSDALFPSLVGSSSQEAYNAEKNGIDSADLPMLGSSSFEPLEVSKGGDTGTFVGQKVMPASITKQLALSKLNYKSAQLPAIRKCMLCCKARKTMFSR